MTPLPPMVIHALPDHDLSANGRDGRLNKWARADLVKATIAQFQPVALSWLAASGLKATLQGPLALRWTLYVPALRGDASGWAGALKPWEDVLTARHKDGVGIIADDGPRVVWDYIIRVRKDPATAPCTILEILPLA